jgi:hypothetical protein
VQCNHLRKLDDGTMTIVPGINILPWDVLAFIYASIDCISTPFSSPRGDYEGAAHRAECANVQQAFYTGYIKGHGIKVKTLFLPNGISTLFGPVSAWQADASVAAMSNLNVFLVLIQRGHFFSPAVAEVLLPPLVIWHLIWCISAFSCITGGHCAVDRCAEALQRCNEVGTHHH